MTLKDLKIGKSAVIRKVGGEGALRQHILDMGLIPGCISWGLCGWLACL
ncbi:MAG: ferrous iron transport protein A [Clostridiales bacterium]|nr:ferrous iron transport protein A [Clostridiales bacterium]